MRIGILETGGPPEPYELAFGDYALMFERLLGEGFAYQVYDVAGGMLPSPTALVVLLAAVALDRIAYGLALIGAFSIGLATALVVVGLIALRARDAVADRMSGRTARLVPVLSAASIALLGLVLAFRGFVQI